MNKLSKIFQNNSGFTLVETLVALAIIGIIGSIITVSIVQIVRTSVENNNQMEAIKQAENAAFYFNRDGQMATEIISPDNQTLVLNWTKIDGVTGTTTYRIIQEGTRYILQRNDGERIDILAKNLDNTKTTWALQDGILKITLTLKINSQFKENKNIVRKIYIQPRLSQYQ